MSILSNVKLSSVPEIKADKFRGVATIGTVEERTLDSGKIMITVPFEYEVDNKERKFTDRIIVNEEWFDESYVPLDPNQQEPGSDEFKEAFSYQLNMSRKLRKIAKEVGLDSIDLDQLEGKSIGIVLGPESDKRDPSRQELKSVYKAK